MTEQEIIKRIEIKLARIDALKKQIANYRVEIGRKQTNLAVVRLDCVYMLKTFNKLDSEKNGLNKLYRLQNEIIRSKKQKWIYTIL